MKQLTWKDLRIAVSNVPNENLMEFIFQYPKPIRKALAIALSIAHWQRGHRPNLRQLGPAYCGLCAFYNMDCDKCPLGKIDPCIESGSCYDKAEIAKCEGMEIAFSRAADQLYNILVELYKKEYKKLPTIEELE